MDFENYKRIRAVVVILIGAIVSYAVLQNSIFIAISGATIGMLVILVLRRGIVEVTHDERLEMIQNKASSATLGFTTVGLAIAGLSMVFLGRQGFGDFEQTGYILAMIANLVLGLNALLRYYYAGRFGG